ncbi:LLM class oxidoreductase [Methylophaga sulfidovorans]|uniref:Luciferase-type oxidoreductase, BA3436 family n=1 Tax=Methylophaga sulfidovorans TaxID=45496 RepID=A0A1I4B8N5_9GAMM|nr:LLM class oxidoreductase [Methylophaga sulfidovorans]SFK65155.1 luciferase-type oxidoreductase, BA3436 family [Methylophaga sulfidovorans]
MTHQYNIGYNTLFSQGRLSIGLTFPLEAYQGDSPTMENQETLAQLAENLGFSALWFRDVPLRDPTFGDVGHIYDPIAYMGWMAAQTQHIALVTGSLILPLRHPIHVAKSLASVNALSNGRVVAGIASGDRAIEFPAFGVNRDQREQLFREHFTTLKKLLYNDFPHYDNHYGALAGEADSLPKPDTMIPLLVTGHSQQSLEWIAEQADGWITYPRQLPHHEKFVTGWHQTVSGVDQGFKPFAQSLYVDLTEDGNATPTPIHLGIRTGRKALVDYLQQLKIFGVNHVAINLKYGKRPANEVMQELGEMVLPHIQQ